MSETQARPAPLGPMPYVIAALSVFPILGALFRSTQYQNNQTELVILVTPYIVKPVDKPTLLATPLDGYTPPTDAERILLGRLHGESPQLANSSVPAVNSPASVFEGVGGQAGFLIR